jgi:signal transduction histidine kinase
MCILENIFSVRSLRNPLIYICLLLPFSLMAQSRIDSLERELQKQTSDSIKVRIYISLAYNYQYIDLKKAKSFAEDAISLAQKNDLKRGESYAHETLGALYTLSGDYITALKHDNKAFEIFSSRKDSIGLASIYNSIGDDYFDIGEYDEAYHYYTQAYKISKSKGDSLLMTISVHNWGRVFKELGQFDAAMDKLLISQKLSEQIDDEEGLPYSLDEIGDIQLRKQEYDAALSTLTRALRLTRELNIQILEPRTLTKLAVIHLHKKSFDKALAYYDSTNQLHIKTNNQLGSAEVELGKAKVYAEQNKLDAALQSVEKSLLIARKLNARTLEAECFNQFTRLWEKKGDYQRSLKYLKQYKQLEDSLFSHDMQQKLLREQVLFETEHKDTQIAALRSQQGAIDEQLKRQEFIRNILVVVMALSVILLATVYRSGQRRRQINTLLLQHQEEMEKRSEELERLNQVKDKFFSIISHDLRSPINALSGLLDLLDKGAISPEELPLHVGELKVRFNHTRTLLNNLLDWTLLQMDKLNLQPTKIDLHKIVEENIQLLGAVQTKKITLTNNIPPLALAYADSNTINLVMRNLMTNAIKFTNDGGDVVINAQQKDNQWLVSVRDNGIGMNHDVLKILFDKTAPYTTRGTANEKGTGLGLILCKEFVEKNSGKIWVESTEGKGSTFYFTLPRTS